MTAANDSADLEALFDSIAADIPAAPPPPDASKSGDNDDLQALFDSMSTGFQAPAVEVSPAPVAAAATAPAPAPAADVAAGIWPVQEAVFNRIGLMARELHNTLRELGYDKILEQTVSALPDAKDRLAYVANLTEQAACRVLNATDVANPVVENVENNSRALGQRWDKMFANQLSVEEFRQLATDTRKFLNGEVPQQMQATRAQLTEIMMAQDFQDLTGQVIKKIVALAQTLENGLMNVLIEVVPETKRTEEVTNLMNGPVINAEGRSDVVVNQQQVDDLLESLGF